MVGKSVISRDPSTVANRILDAAEAVFMAEGFAGASTNAMLQRFGGSKATIFRHFPTKNDLLAGVIARIGERITAGARLADLTQEEPRAWLTAFAERALGVILREDALFVGRMVVAQGHNFPVLRETFVAVAVDPMLAVLVDRLRLWQANGAIRCDEFEADAILFFDMVMAGWISRSLFGMRPDVTPAFLAREAARAATLFLDGRRPRD